MKKILLFVFIIIFTSCLQIVPIDNYKDGIVKDVYLQGKGDFEKYYFDLQIQDPYTISKYQIIKIRVLHSDFIRYNVGDTIK